MSLIRVFRTVLAGAIAISVAVVSSPGIVWSQTDTTRVVAKKPLAEPIKRAGFTSAIEEREPVDDVDSLTADGARIFYFTEIVNMQGRVITHRWIYEDKTMAEVTFQIGGPRWRVYSSKNLLPKWIGVWKVEVVDDAGSVLHVDSLGYVPAGE